MLSDLHEELRRSVRDFVVKEVFPIADVLDSEEKDIPEEIIKKMAELGYFGLVFPDEVGGVGLAFAGLAERRQCPHPEPYHWSAHPGPRV
jgi:alkylation response protein AidB-like acyl-CoA dehydrogenase